MTALIALLILPVFAAGSDAHCAWSLGTIPRVELFETIKQTQLSAARVPESLDALEGAFTRLGVWGAADRGAVARLVHQNLSRLTSIASQYSMGNDQAADELLRTFPSGLIDRASLGKELRLVADRFQVPLTLLQFVDAGLMTPEMVAYHSLLEHRRRGLPPADATPSQIEGIKVALQYGGTRGPVKVLEIGHGSTATLESLAYFTNKPVVGVDAHPVAPDLASWLVPMQIEVVRGLVPDGATMNALRARGPYQVIFAQDVFTATAFRGDADRLAMALRPLLNPGGVLILVNDRAEAPNFTRADAEDAGFAVVRWNVPRPLAPEWLRHLPEPLRTAGVGQLRVFVLRSGAADFARARGDLTQVRDPRPDQ